MSAATLAIDELEVVAKTGGGPRYTACRPFVGPVLPTAAHDAAIWRSRLRDVNGLSSRRWSTARRDGQ